MVFSFAKLFLNLFVIGLMKHEASIFDEENNKFVIGKSCFHYLCCPEVAAVNITVHTKYLLFRIESRAGIRVL